VIRALPDNLPDFFDVDISQLKIGDNILVESLLNDDFTILHPDTTVVVQVKAARAALVIETDEEEELEGVEGAEGEASEDGAETPAAEEASEGAKE
jgi:large subunit ribosomal protein L25